MCWCCPKGLPVSAGDYVCMYLIKYSTGQLTRWIFLSLMSTHGLFVKSWSSCRFHTGASVWSWNGPPTTPQTAAPHRCSAVFWLMHSSVFFLFVLMTIMSPMGNFDFLQILLRQLLTPAISLPRHVSGCQSRRLHTFSARDNRKRASKRAAIESEHVGMSCPLLERLLFIITPSTGKIQFPARAYVC